MYNKYLKIVIFFCSHCQQFIIVRNEVAKVMFPQACVCPQGGLLPGGVHGPGRGFPACTEAAPPGRDGYCCGRYASHRNAFLLKVPPPPMIKRSLDFFFKSSIIAHNVKSTVCSH